MQIRDYCIRDGVAATSKIKFVHFYSGVRVTSEAGHAAGDQFSSQNYVVLQKKLSSLGISFRFFIFRPKIIVFSKKVFARDWPQISLLSSQNRGVFYKVKEGHHAKVRWPCKA